MQLIFSPTAASGPSKSDNIDDQVRVMCFIFLCTRIIFPSISKFSALFDFHLSFFFLLIYYFREDNNRIICQREFRLKGTTAKNYKTITEEVNFCLVTHGMK